MKSLELLKVRILILCFAFVLIFNVPHLFAQETTSVSGSMVLTEALSEEMEVGDTESHLFGITKSEGLNTNTGTNTFMDGAGLIILSSIDVVKGNGHHHGYTIFTRKNNTVHVKWTGVITTTTSKSGTMNTSYVGTFQYINGTGNYKNIKGSGTYKGKMVDEGKITVDWQGDYYIWDETKTGVADY